MAQNAITGCLAASQLADTVHVRLAVDGWRAGAALH